MARRRAARKASRVAHGFRLVTAVVLVVDGFPGSSSGVVVLVVQCGSRIRRTLDRRGVRAGHGGYRMAGNEVGTRREVGKRGTNIEPAAVVRGRSAFRER